MGMSCEAGLEHLTILDSAMNYKSSMGFEENVKSINLKQN